MLRPLSCLIALCAPFLFAVPACDDTRPVAPIHDGLAECELIGELCHEPGERLGGRYEECHDIGHLNEGKECLKAYDECSTLCKAATGSGGEGGGGEGGRGEGGRGEGGGGGERAGAPGAGAGGAAND